MNKFLHDVQDEKENEQPLECLKCGRANGPLAVVDADHAGYICDDCYSQMQANGIDDLLVNENQYPCGTDVNRRIRAAYLRDREPSADFDYWYSKHGVLLQQSTHRSALEAAFEAGRRDREQWVSVKASDDIPEGAHERRYTVRRTSEVSLGMMLTHYRMTAASPTEDKQ